MNGCRTNDARKSGRKRTLHEEPKRGIDISQQNKVDMHQDDAYLWMGLMPGKVSRWA